jgi:hypothetical protein
MGKTPSKRCLSRAEVFGLRSSDEASRRYATSNAGAAVSATFRQFCESVTLGASATVFRVNGKKTLHLQLNLRGATAGSGGAEEQGSFELSDASPGLWKPTCGNFVAIKLLSLRAAMVGDVLRISFPFEYLGASGTVVMDLPRTVP